jgi:hypothetical protein
MNGYIQLLKEYVQFLKFMRNVSFAAALPFVMFDELVTALELVLGSLGLVVLHGALELFLARKLTPVH